MATSRRTDLLARAILVAAAFAAGGVRGAAQVASAPPGPAPSAMVELSLEEAIGRSLDRSEEVGLARSAIEAAETRITAARSAWLPQINATTSYTRTFESAFSRGLDFEFPGSERFDPDPTAPLEARVSYLEQNADAAVLTTLTDLVSASLQGVGLGSPHTYAANIGGSQTLFSGGRIGAAIGIATNVRDAARFSFREQAAQVELNVRTAYYRALLAAELETIAVAALEQAESFFGEEQLRRKAGYASELDVLRAEVSLENLRPQLVDARNARDLALLDLKRLVNVPVQQAVRLTTPLATPGAAGAEPPVDPARLVAQRAAIQAAERQVAAREQAVRAARAAYLPSVALQVAYGGQIFPLGLFDAGGAPWQPNSSATVGIQIPLFSGLQRSADVGQAQVQLRQAQLEAAQLREAVLLEYEQARAERERARAAIAARERTVEQALRVYDLTILRYDQGLATQLEISDARLALLQARTNLAEALADFHIASAGVTRSRGLTTIPVASAPPAAGTPDGAPQPPPLAPGAPPGGPP